MVRHDSSLRSKDDLLSVTEPVATDPAETAVSADRLEAQFHSSQRLNEYYNQVVAELRASLAEIGVDDCPTS